MSIFLFLTPILVFAQAHISIASNSSFIVFVSFKVIHIFVLNNSYFEFSSIESRKAHSNTNLYICLAELVELPAACL